MKSGILYSGNQGSFSWEAGRRAKAQHPELTDLLLIESLDPPTAIQRFWNREYSHALLPIFNPSLGGAVPSSKLGFIEVGCPLPEEDTPLDQWIARFTELNRDKIMGEPIPLPIDFYIHALPGTKPEDIKRLAAYSMAIQQCEEGIIRVVGRSFENVPYSDTGKAAHDLRSLSDDPTYEETDPEVAKLKPLNHTAVLGPAWCSELFGLVPVWKGVQDLPEGNVTSFILLRNPDTV